jgi:hypothetical protein
LKPPVTTTTSTCIDIAVTVNVGKYVELPVECN